MRALIYQTRHDLESRDHDNLLTQKSTEYYCVHEHLGIIISEVVTLAQLNNEETSVRPSQPFNQGSRTKSLFKRQVLKAMQILLQICRWTYRSTEAVGAGASLTRETEHTHKQSRHSLDGSLGGARPRRGAATRCGLMTEHLSR